MSLFAHMHHHNASKHAYTMFFHFPLNILKNYEFKESKTTRGTKKKAINNKERGKIYA